MFLLRVNRTAAALAFVALMLVTQTYRSESAWSSSVALWDRAVSAAPMKPRVLLNAGVAHVDAGDLRGACPLILRASSFMRPSDEWASTVRVAAMIDLYTLRTVMDCP